MALVIATLIVVLVGFVTLLPLRRLRREVRDDQPEWTAEWKRTSRAKKREIARALRRGETPYNPDDARLLVGLGRRADLYQRANMRWWRWHLAVAAVLAILALASGNVGLAVAAVPALASALLLRRVILPRTEARRRRVVASAEQVAGLHRSRRDGRWRSGFTPSTESRPGTSRAPAP